MRRLRDIVQHPYAPAWGAELAADDEPQPAASVLPAATAENLHWAATYWPQADPDEYEWDVGRRRMQARHRETGVLYTIEIGMPINALASGISTYCVRGNRLVLLQDRPDRIVAQGPTATVTMREIPNHYSGPPQDGTPVIF